MIRVRFPNGQCVTYNSGWYVETQIHHFSILTVERGAIAFAPFDCIIEWVTPCEVGNPLTGNLLERAASYVESLSGSVSWSEGKQLSRLKNAMRRWNARSRRFW